MHGNKHLKLLHIARSIDLLTNYRAVAIFVLQDLIRKKEGDLLAKKRMASPRKLKQEQLSNFINSHLDAYLREVADFFGVTIKAIFYAFKKRKISLKKDDIL